MFTHQAKTGAGYLKPLPPDRRRTRSTVRDVVLEHLRKGTRPAGRRATNGSA
jgi:hypothetical protein